VNGGLLEPDDREARWIDGIRRGEEQTFAAVVRELYPPLYDFAAGITRDGDAARDVIQDVLAAVWERRSEFAPATTVRAYLFRAVRNRAINHFRRRNTDPYLEDQSVSAAVPPDEYHQYREVMAAYHKAIARLPERRRAVYSLVRLYGLSYDETAAILEISTNTVRTQMSDALKSIRTALLDYTD